MKKKDVIRVFAGLGWHSYRDEVGDWVIVMRLDDVVVWNVPTVKTLRVSGGVNVTNDAFDYAYNCISGKTNRVLENDVIMQTWKDFEIRKAIDAISLADIISLSDQMKDWAETADIEEGLAALRALPTDCLGARPTRHLAALAVAGDVETLAGYKDSFVRGDRLGFVPYVDEGYIQRAYEFASKRRECPNWLPEKPQMRI